MKQVFITGHGGPDKLQLREAPDPQPGEGQVRVRVRASGINFADILARKGFYPDAPKLPCVVGYEVSGVIDALGPGVGAEWQGREVIAMTRFTGYADTVVVPVQQVFDKPASLSFEQAAAIPVNYVTAWQLMVAVGSLSKDETVLIHNAGSGVGLAAIDIGRHLGATLIGTASAGKHAFLKERGLHHAIDYRGSDWSPELNRLTEGRGVELILDPLGGSHWKKSYKALRHTGRLGMFGISTASESGLIRPLAFAKIALSLPLFNPIGLMNDNRSVFGVNLGHMWHENGKVRSWVQILLQGVADGWVRPHVDKTFPLAEVGAAQTYIEQRRNTGKVVLVP
ncbi:MAG TPA: medium chain dehydrogenase/reductase family protein [Nevskia sp.]|nr:medium chain dehydrogenase/reductase family protein [Nevskia sp.]